MNLHAILPRSRANGPGLRTVLWVQGCSLGCPGCFNPDTHASEPRQVIPVTDLIARLAAGEGEIEGVTISGGEPLQQAPGLRALLESLRAASRLSVVLFSGHTKEEILAMSDGPAILACVDVLIDGRYKAQQRLGQGLRGSANQRIHFLTDRYTAADLDACPTAEVIVAADGQISVSGVDPPRRVREAWRWTDVR